MGARPPNTREAREGEPEAPAQESAPQTPAALCRICGGRVPPREANPSRPFCSPRCKLTDLGSWLDGSYRIPGPPLASDDLDASTISTTGSEEGE